MADPNETVTVEMAPGDRLRIYSQITGRMTQLGMNHFDYSQLNLGFELPSTWPADENAQPTLAQLVIVACKLNMRIIISDLNLVPRKTV